MTIDDKIRDEKLQYDINREAGEEILPPDQQRVIEQAKLTRSPLRKASEKQRKTIEDQGIKQVEALKAFKEENQELK